MKTGISGTEEQTQYDGLLAEAQSLQVRAERMETLEGMAGGVLAGTLANRQAPANNRIPLGDNEARAYCHYLRTGDAGGLQHAAASGLEGRASNDTTMNVTTAADGTYAVPTGHYQGIIARRDESMLANVLGVRQIPGPGNYGECAVG